MEGATGHWAPSPRRTTPFLAQVARPARHSTPWPSLKLSSRFRLESDWEAPARGVLSIVPGAPGPCVDLARAPAGRQASLLSADSRARRVLPRASARPPDVVPVTLGARTPRQSGAWGCALPRRPRPAITCAPEGTPALRLRFRFHHAPALGASHILRFLPLPLLSEAPAAYNTVDTSAVPPIVRAAARLSTSQSTHTSTTGGPPLSPPAPPPFSGHPPAMHAGGGASSCTRASVPALLVTLEHPTPASLAPASPTTANHVPAPPAAGRRRPASRRP